MSEQSHSSSTDTAQPLVASVSPSGIKIKDLLLKWSNYIALALLVLVASLLSPYFLEFRNIFNVLRGASIIGIVSIGMTFVILNRGIDLSVGSLVGASAVISATLAPLGTEVAASAAVALTIFMGIINGLVITRLRLQPFIATLAMLIFIRGLVYIHTDGSNIIVRNATPIFKFLGSGHIGPVPTPLIIFIVVWLVSHYVLKHTQFGRHVYAVGANEVASRLYGINVNWVKMKVYAVSGFMCGLAGVILTSRLTVAEPNAGQLYELEAIAATLIGGTPFEGGVGGVGGTMLGVLILALLGNILNLMDVSPYYQMLLQGGIIVLAVVISEARLRKR